MRSGLMKIWSKFHAKCWNFFRNHTNRAPERPVLPNNTEERPRSGFIFGDVGAVLLDDDVGSVEFVDGSVIMGSEVSVVVSLGEIVEIGSNLINCNWLGGIFSQDVLKFHATS